MLRLRLRCLACGCLCLRSLSRLNRRCLALRCLLRIYCVIRCFTRLDTLPGYCGVSSGSLLIAAALILRSSVAVSLVALALRSSVAVSLIALALWSSVAVSLTLRSSIAVSLALRTLRLHLRVLRTENCCYFLLVRLTRACFSSGRVITRRLLGRRCVLPSFAAFSSSAHRFSHDRRLVIRYIG